MEILWKSKLKNTNFAQHKSPIWIYGIYAVNIDKIVLTNRVPFDKKGFKYFISYKDAKKVKLLCVMPLKMIAYRRGFDGYIF